MSKRVPVVRQTSWRMVIPQMIILAVLVYGGGFLLYEPLGTYGFFVGAAIYLLWSFGSRWIIARFQRQGM